MDAPRFEALTQTERRVLRLVHHSQKSEAIASALGISRHTVDQHIKAARGKLGNVGRYVAADLLRAHENAHPQLQGNAPLGMAGTPPLSPSIAHPDRSVEELVVAEDRTPLSPSHHAGRLGQADPPDDWLQQTTLLTRFILVLVAAFLLLLLIVSAPLIATQMGQIGRLLYE